MIFADLFAGIGGFRLGLERAGMQCRWACEIDPFCRKVYLKHWPETEPFYEDIRTVTDPPAVDLLCGGFPCQDLSLAGKRTGITGERSGLWSEFARLIGEIRPRYALVENVPGLLTGGRNFGRVLGDLAEIGYDAEWHCIPAAAFGAPHIRNRVWIVAYANGARQGRVAGHSGATATNAGIGSEVVADADVMRRNGGGCPQGDILHTDWNPQGEKQHRNRRLNRVGADGEDVPDTPGIRRKNSKRLLSELHRSPARDRQGEGFRNGSRWDSRNWVAEPRLGELVDGLPPELAGRFIRVARGCPDRANKLRALGNAVVPQVVEWLGRRIMEGGAG